MARTSMRAISAKLGQPVLSAAGTHPWRFVGRPNVRTALAANRADEPRLDIGNAHLVRPTRRVHLDVVRAPVVLAEDDDPRCAGFAHFAERDLGGIILRAQDYSARWRGLQSHES